MTRLDYTDTEEVQVLLRELEVDLFDISAKSFPQNIFDNKFEVRIGVVYYRAALFSE